MYVRFYKNFKLNWEKNIHHKELNYIAPEVLLIIPVTYICVCVHVLPALSFQHVLAYFLSPSLHILN
jgi:hypothetical protein